MKKITVFSPATVANVGPGFDIMGFALDSVGDTLIAETSSEPGVRIKKITGDNGKLPKVADKNTASIGAISVMEKLRVKEGMEITLNKGLRLNSGMGSSGASAVAGAFAALKLFAPEKEKGFVLEDCIKAEATVSGHHADNVAPSLFGGFVIIRSYDPLDVIRLRAPAKLNACVVTPNYEVSTKEARMLLPSSVPMSSLVHNTGNVAALVAGIALGDCAIIGRSISDSIIEPVRAKLIPGYSAVKKAAMESGALGCAIAGSGPSMFAFSDLEKTAIEISNAMAKAFEHEGLSSDKLVSKVNGEGAKVIGK